MILDAQTGEILALANWPTYNPNARNKVAREKMRNRALTDVFEPGSTMKPFTIAAALEAGQVRPDTRDRDRRRARSRSARNTIHDAHPNGALTVEQVIQKSSNVGAAQDRAVAAARDDVGDVRPTPASARRRRTGFPGRGRRAGCGRRRPGSRSSRRRWRTATACR